MKTLSFFIFLILIMSCNNTQKSDVETTKSSTSTEKVENTINSNSDISLKQLGDYSRLFSMDGECKLSKEEVATLFSLSSSQINTHIEVISPCRYNITYNDGSSGYYAVTLSALTKKRVQKEIEGNLANSYKKNLFQKSESGDHYIFKHPNQGYLLLYNPNYENVVKIQYRTMLISGLTKEQLETLEEIGYRSANYLITKYQD